MDVFAVFILHQLFSVTERPKILSGLPRSEGKFFPAANGEMLGPEILLKRRTLRLIAQKLGFHICRTGPVLSLPQPSALPNDSFRFLTPFCSLDRIFDLFNVF